MRKKNVNLISLLYGIFLPRMTDIDGISILLFVFTLCINNLALFSFSVSDLQCRYYFYVHLK